MAEDAAGQENAPGGTPGGSQDGGQGSGAGGDAGAAQETVAAIEEPLFSEGGEETQGTPPSAAGTPAQPGEDDDDSTEANEDSDATEALESQDNDAHEDDGQEDNAPAPPSQGDAGGEDVVTPQSTGSGTSSGTKDKGPPPPPPGRMKGPLKDKTKATQRQGRALMAPGGLKTSKDWSDPSSLTSKDAEMQIAAWQKIKAEKDKALALRDEQSPPTWDDNSSADVYMPKENGTHANKEKPLVQSRSDRKHWSRMFLVNFVSLYYLTTNEDPMVFKDAGKKHSFFRDFKMSWESGKYILDGEKQGEARSKQGKDLVSYIQNFMEYLALMDIPWKKHRESDLYLVFAQGLRGEAFTKFQDIRRRCKLAGMNRTFAENFDEFTRGYLENIKDLGRRAVMELHNASQREGENVFQYWARLQNLHSTAARENSSFQEWDEGRLMDKWESSLERKLYEHVTSQRHLDEDNAGFGPAPKIPNAVNYPEAYRHWVRAEESRYALLWAQARKEERRAVYRRAEPQKGQGARQQGLYINRGPPGQRPHNGGRNNRNSPAAAVAQVNVANGDNKDRDNRVKAFQARFGVFPGAPIIPKMDKDRKQRVQQAKKIGVCLGCHQHGHISSDPQCPAKNDARWHSGKFYNRPKPGNAHAHANVVAEPDYDGGFQDYGYGAQDYGYGVQGTPSQH